MTALDWVLVVIWVGITLGGFFKGAIRIVFGLGGVGLGIWLAIVVSPDLAVALTGRVDSEWLLLGLAYLIPFVVVSLLCLLAGWGMEKTLEAVKLGCVNRLLGGALAGSVAAVVLALLLVSAVRMSPEVAEIQRRSVLLDKARMIVGVAAEIADDEGEDAQEADRPATDTDPGSTSGR